MLGHRMSYRIGKAVFTMIALTAAGESAAAPGDVSWELIRPTNTGIPGDFCYSLFIDDDDSPWISGFTTFWEEGGVSHFDGNVWRVLGNVDCDQITTPRFREIVKTDDGIRWIATGDGLLRFDPTEEPWCVTRLHTGNTPMPADGIEDIAVAPDGSLWLALDGSPQGGLAHYVPASDTWQIWDTGNGIPWDAVWNWVDYVAVQPNVDDGYTVWLGNGPMGLASFSDGQWTWYGGSNPPNLDPLPIDVYGERSVDDHGNMLLQTDKGFALRAPDGTYTMLPLPPGGASTLDILGSGRVVAATGTSFSVWDGSWTSLGPWGGNSSMSFGEESNGAIWVCGTGGAARYADGLWQRYRVTNTGMLDFWHRGIAFAPNGDVAMSANAAPGVGGFDILHPDRSWTNANIYTYGLGQPWPFPCDNTDAVAYRSNGNLLFAPTNNGLREFDGDHYIDRIISASIEHIEIAGNGRAWAATGRAGPTAGVYPENADGTWTQSFGYNDGVPTADILGLVADPLDPDKVFIAGQFGIAHTDGVTWEMIPREAIGLTLNTTSHLLLSFDVGLDGTLWIGAAGMGLYEYDMSSGTYNRYDTTNTPIPASVVQDIEIAPDGSLWVSVMDLQNFPYPGGVVHYKDGVWRVWSEGSSPLPHNQVWDLETRPVAGGYEVWIACASEAIAVITVQGEDLSCNPADLAEPFGVLDIDDVLFFLDAFVQSDQLADLAPPSGQLNIDDVLLFLDTFAIGCP